MYRWDKTRKTPKQNKTKANKKAQERHHQGHAEVQTLVQQTQEGMEVAGCQQGMTPLLPESPTGGAVCQTHKDRLGAVPVCTPNSGNNACLTTGTQQTFAEGETVSGGTKLSSRKTTKGAGHP